MWRDETGEEATDSVLEATFWWKGREDEVRYELAIGEASGAHLEVEREISENAVAKHGKDKPYFYYRNESGRAQISVKADPGDPRRIVRDDILTDQSILAQRKDPDHYPEITTLGRMLDSVRIYRDWSFGRSAPTRRPQKADGRTDFLDEDSGNLGLILNNLQFKKGWPEVLDHLGALYEGVRDVQAKVHSGYVEVFAREGSGRNVPASRLSDGTLRYLHLLAVLCHPSPPPLICLEEPELGLHPDVQVRLANLLLEASHRTQLVVTTHSDLLVDALTEHLECIVVCEREDGRTSLRRLDRSSLSGCIDSYRLGELRNRGHLGGTRW